jgi:hypothetical protein
MTDMARDSPAVLRRCSVNGACIASTLYANMGRHADPRREREDLPAEKGAYRQTALVAQGGPARLAARIVRGEQ